MRRTRRAWLLNLFMLLALLTVAVPVGLHLRHRAAVDRLHKDPSYVYGAQLMREVVNYRSYSALSERDACRQAVAAKPPNVDPYDPEKAYQGRWDENVALNR
jgi:hypothetical protein